MRRASLAITLLSPPSAGVEILGGGSKNADAVRLTEIHELNTTVLFVEWDAEKVAVEWEEHESPSDPSSES